MNVETTNYLKNALLESSHPTIPFKDNDFVSFTYDEFLEDSYDIDASHSICSLLNTKELEILFNDLPKEEQNKLQSVQINCVVSYKTLKSEFFSQERIREYVSELTGVYYFPFSIEFSRIDKGAHVTYHFNKNKTPWFARSFMFPKYIETTPIVASVKDVDKYKSDTTEIRAKIKCWKDYIEYCNGLFDATADSTIQYEDKCFVFRYDINRNIIVSEISNLYQKLIDDNSEHKLYDNIIDLNFKNTKELIQNSDIKAALSHCGQMNGKFPLAASQRQVVHHMNGISDGELIAVSGPPGTGKTTLLQSVVADMIVKSALNSKEPPVIVATSANNQAVTNIIDSFSSIVPIGISNLEERWINGVNSFATYMPSSSRKDDAKKKGYQYTSIFDCEFITDAEAEIDNSIAKMKNSAGLYFGKEFLNIDAVKQALKNELLCIDDLKNRLLTLSEQINEFTEGMELTAYISMLKQSKTETENAWLKYKKRLAEWKKFYDKIGRFKRFFSFIPSFKKQISNQLLIEILPEETKFFSKEISFDEINNKYALEISNKVRDISEFNKRIDEAQLFHNEAFNIIKNLQDKNCCLHLLNGDSLAQFNISNINDLIDTKVRYIEFWLAIHINECRFLEEEYTVKETQRRKTFRNVLEKFYKQIALISPCFVMTTYKLPSNFKCYDGGYLFDYIDLLIFDEAGQCSPEIAAANFSLAKKAIVVGDECQIPPVYNLDSTMDIALAIQNSIIKDDGEFGKLMNSGLSCSQGSIMKVAKKSCQYSFNDNVRGMFLCEHRRCYDEIIAYCNELVYDGLLIPMRNKDEKAMDRNRILDKKSYPFMGYYDIPCSHSKHVGTSRINELEASSIAKWLKDNYDKICSLYQTDNPDINQNNIIAVITPFASQASLIRRFLKSEMGEAYESISVGTVHTFQGAERNIIIFSTVYGSNDGGFFIDNNRNLMNVAVSRAKDAFWVFGDIDFLKNKTPNKASGLLYNRVVNNPID